MVLGEGKMGFMEIGIVVLMDSSSSSVGYGSDVWVRVL